MEWLSKFLGLIAFSIESNGYEKSPALSVVLESISMTFIKAEKSSMHKV